MAPTSKSCAPKLFPRGGTIKKKPIEKVSAKDGLFSSSQKPDERPFNVGKKIKKKKKSKVETRSQTHTKTVENRPKAIRVDPLSYDDLCVGLRVQASVFAINELELKLSLPGRLVAAVHISQISRPYTEGLKKVAEGGEDADDVGVRPLKDMFSVGQLVTCSILSVEKSAEKFYRVEATLAPHLVYESMFRGSSVKGAIVMAAVKSIQDHGYVMDLGMPKVNAFLSRKKAQKYVDSLLKGQSPSVGQLIPCLVTECDGFKALLSADPAKLRAHVICPDDELSVHSLMPGMTFAATVTADRVLDGAKVQFADFFGLIHSSHIDPTSSLTADDDVVATVLYVLPTVNSIFMSAMKHTRFGFTGPDPFGVLKIGDLVKDAEIVRVERRGLLLKLDSTPHWGFVPLQKTSDKKLKPSDLREAFSCGQKKACRIFQYNFIDRQFLCSMEKALLKDNLVIADQLKVGDFVSCSIKKFNPKGVLVTLGLHNVTAFIPLLHLSDVPLSHPDKKFSVGQTLQCRVLRVDHTSKKLLLTHKKLLLKKELSLVDSFDSRHLGVITQAMVSKVLNAGLVLQLFNGVTGWVPKSKISQELVEYPEKLFFEGQVVRCRVIDVKPDQRRMTLSLILTELKLKPFGKKQKEDNSNVQLGHIYSVTVTEVAADGLQVKLSDKENCALCFIPAGHLSDHVEMAKIVLPFYRAGQTIKQALCFEKDVIPVLTLKPSLIRAAGSDVQADKGLEDLVAGDVLPCVVSSIKSYGIFLKMPTWKFTKSALVPTRLLSDVFIETPSDVITLHQSISGKVVEKDEEKQCVTMTTKCKDLMADPIKAIQESVSQLSDLLHDMDRLRTHCSSEQLAAVSLGEPVLAVVKQVTEFGLEVEVQGHGVRGIITNTSLSFLKASSPCSFSVGQNLSGVVTFIDYQFDCIEICPHPEMVKRATLGLDSVKKPEPGQCVKARPILKRSTLHYVMMVVERPNNLSGHIIYVPTRHHINDFFGHADLFSFDQVYNLSVQQHHPFTIGVLKKHLVEQPGKAKKRSGSATQDMTVKKSRRNSEPDSTASKEASGNTAGQTQIKFEDPGWDVDYDPWKRELKMEADDDDDDDDDDMNPDKEGRTKPKTHLSKKQKKELDRLEQEEIAKVEQNVIDGVITQPDSVEDFDRLVLASPNSSLCWIQYMAYHLARQEAQLARQVAERALEKINFREEEERLNVYLALFNLENNLGRQEESAKIMKEALKRHDQFKVYSSIAALYQQKPEQLEQAEKLYKLMVRKFAKDLQVWIQLGQFYFDSARLVDARFTLQRSLQALDQKHHVEVSSRFAQMEFKKGESERGKTIFENIVSNHPKRSDQWSVYADMLIKHNELDAARTLFERMILLNLPAKKMKFFFKKYLDFEQQHGSQQQVDQVRKKALQYVQDKFGTQGQQDPEEILYQDD